MTLRMPPRFPPTRDRIAATPTPTPTPTPPTPTPTEPSSMPRSRIPLPPVRPVPPRGPAYRNIRPIAGESIRDFADRYVRVMLHTRAPERDIAAVKNFVDAFATRVTFDKPTRERATMLDLAPSEDAEALESELAAAASVEPPDLFDDGDDNFPEPEPEPQPVPPPRPRIPVPPPRTPRAPPPPPPAPVAVVDDDDGETYSRAFLGEDED